MLTRVGGLVRRQFGYDVSRFVGQQQFRHIHRTFLKKKLIELFRAEILNKIPSRMLQKENGKVIPWK